MTDQTNEQPEQTTDEVKPLQTIGDYLRQERERSGHSLKYISNKTKISLTQLESLENNRLDQLPDKTYVQGFIKALCKYVELNKEAAIEKLNDTYDQLYPERKVVDLKVLTPKETSNASPLMVFGIIGLVVVFLGYGVFNYLKNRSLEKIRAELQAPIKTRTLTSKSPLMEDAVKPEVMVQNEQDNETEIQEEVVEKEEPASVEVKKEEEPVVAEVKPEVKPEIKEEPKVEAKEEEKKEKIKFYPITFTMYEKETNNSAALIEEHLPKNIQTATNPGEQNIFIKAVSGDTWITYKKDLLPVKKFVLKKDRTLFISGKIVRVFLGNVHATKIFLNNEPLKIESKSGVKSLVFPAERAKDYKLPLFVFKDSGEVIPSDQYIEGL